MEEYKLSHLKELEAHTQFTENIKHRVNMKMLIHFFIYFIISFRSFLCHKNHSAAG